jgi:hypothetical protein
MTAELPERFCRFCKELTQQLVQDGNERERVCTICWRRQEDGQTLVISTPPGPKRASSAPPPPPSYPPPPPHEYALRTDLNDARRLLAELTRRVAAIEERIAVIGNGSFHTHVTHK